MSLKALLDVPGQVDVVVIGAGPAGASTALTLARHGVRVLLTEKPSVGPPLGDGLPPAAAPILRMLGFDGRMKDCGARPAHVVRSSWGSGDLVDVDFVRQPYGMGWQLDRPSFDVLLRDAAVQAGSIFVPRARALAMARRKDGCWTLTFGETMACREVRTAMLVDASGRVCWTTRGASARTVSFDRLVALVGVFGYRGQPLEEPTLVEAVAQGWWYAASLPDGRLTVAYMSDMDLLPAVKARTVAGWTALLQETTYMRERIARQGTVLQGVPRAVSARSACLEKAAGLGWCAVGDAAAAHDPLSSRGLTAAFTTGMRAAEAIAAGGHDSLDGYASWMRDEYARYLGDWLGTYALEQRWPTAAFWQRRHAAWDEVLHGADDIVGAC